MVDTIRAKEPKVAILENVGALLHKDQAETWDSVRSALQQVADDLGYDFFHGNMDGRQGARPAYGSRSLVDAATQA